MTRAPDRRAMSETSSPGDPLSTTMTSDAWGSTDARHSANQVPGRYETTTTDEDTAVSARGDNVAVGEGEESGAVDGRESGLEKPECESVPGQEVDEGSRFAADVLDLRR